MAEPNIAQRGPFPVEVEAGIKYFWCACGKSGNQPFCDGSYAGSEFTPIRYDAQAGGTVFFCGCKHSANRPLCDGTHNSI